MNHGIDYGRGKTNIDPATGIRYGVIPVSALHEWAWDEFEPDYGDPHCPKCGNVAVEWNEEAHGHYPGVPDDQGRVVCSCEYACEQCHVALDGEDVCGDEPCGHTLDDGTYRAFIDTYNDVMLVQSPYYTHAQFCSPCAPGAGYLLSPTDESGPKVYCFGHEWFEGGTAPYPVYRVDNNESVPPEPKE